MTKKKCLKEPIKKEEEIDALKYMGHWVTKKKILHFFCGSAKCL